MIKQKRKSKSFCKETNIYKETAKIMDREGKSPKSIADKLKVTEEEVVNWITKR